MRDGRRVIVDGREVEDVTTEPTLARGVDTLLDDYLPGYDIGARDKNRLFNLIWDMTCSPAAMRIALFENINATPAVGLREQLYRTYDRSAGLAAVRRRAGIDAPKSR